MRGLASCYNEHAIRVSDSYCSSKPSSQAYLCPKITLSSTKYSVTSVYKVNFNSTQKPQLLLISLTWTKKLIGQGFVITVTNNSDPSFHSIPKEHQLRKSKGNETLESQNLHVQVSWDVTAAKYSSDQGPEPIGGFYVDVLVNAEPCLHLGDNKNAEANGGYGSFSLVSRIERFFGNAMFSTKTRFSDAGISHDIVINFRTVDEECYKGHGHDEVVLCVHMDEKRILQVKRLKWNFRGNHTVFVDGLVVDMMWDIHDWLFFDQNNRGSAVFMFRTRSGLDSRLWLLEEKDFETSDNGFSLLICANSKNPD
ncbi:uncharacterized protein LOC130935958 [Arachis stenosperma]|uniref:uncharacterized protein LOC130935958 n=1 Tax=Arachis stenosperma TaxID=217475 RepID=UPI0025AC839E|nr:uncharacterized protein LOC130935958 [Arachis stenosperma]